MFIIKPQFYKEHRDCFLSTECVYVEVIGHHCSVVSGTLSCAWVNGFILQNIVSSLKM